MTCTKSSKLRVHRGGSVLRREVRVGRFTELDEMKFPNRVAFFGPALRGSILNEMNFPSLDEMKFPTPGVFFRRNFGPFFAGRFPELDEMKFPTPGGLFWTKFRSGGRKFG